MILGSTHAHLVGSKRSKRLAQIRDTERESGEAKRQTRMRAQVVKQNQRNLHRDV